MRIWENPPVKKRKKSRKGRRGLRRGPKGRFLPKARRKARRKTKVRRHARRSGGAKMARKRRSKSGRKGKRTGRKAAAKRGAITRKRRKARMRRVAIKNLRKAWRKKGKPRYRRGRKHRYVTRKFKGRFYATPGSPIKGRRINPKRRRRHARRRNPIAAAMGGLKGLFPTSLGQFKDVALVGVGGAAGYLGVNMLNKFADDAFLGAQKDKITNPVLRSVANALQSVVMTFVLAGVSRMVLKNQPRITQGIFAGGATKAILDVVNPFLSQKAAEGSTIAQAGVSGFQEQLSGYQYDAGVAGFQTSPGIGYAAEGFNRISAMNNDEATIFG